jgi:(2Fe-2S) ferredoxin
MPKREKYVFVCINRRPDTHPKGSCAAKGSVDIHAALKEELANRGLSRTGVRACTASCLDVCHLGPTIAVEPDHYMLGRVTLADVPEIVDSFQNGTRVERLVIPDDQYDEPPKKR